MSKSALLKISHSKTVARKIASQVSLGELQKAIQNLQAAQVFLAKQAEKKADAQKAQKIKKAMSLLDRMGLKPEDLGGARKSLGRAKTKARTPRKVAAKYRITVDGVTTEWSGRGRMPVVFRNAIGKRGSIDSYLI